MAEFQMVMHNMARICKKYWPDHEDECSEDCPLYDTWCFNMDADFPQMDRKQQDMVKVEEVVMAWAAEHPEPVYETWLEFVKRFETGGRKSDDDFIYWMGTTSIPADIAEKLGIEPKEDKV